MIQRTKDLYNRKLTRRSVPLPTSCSSTLKRQKFRRVSPCTTAKKKVPQQKYPLTALNEYVCKLKERSAETEKVIKKRDAAIAQSGHLSLTLSPAKTKKLFNETSAPVGDQATQERADSGAIIQQAERLNFTEADFNDMVSKYTTRINQLQSIIKANEEDSAKQLEDYRRKISEKDESLQREQELYKQLKEDYAKSMDKVKLEHEQQLREIEEQHENELIHLRREIEELKKSKLSGKHLDDALEKVLYEIEQEEHNLPPVATTFAHRSSLRSVSTSSTKKPATNQQWYSEKYIPSEAISWPAPQSLPNLKKQLHK